MRKTHVVALVDGLSGGAERYARTLAQNLDGNRYRRTLCVARIPVDPNEEAHVRAELAASGVELLMLGRRHRADLLPWTKLVRFLRSEQVDILHAHKFGSNFWASALRGLGEPRVVIAHEHTWSYEGQPFRRLVDREFISRRCDRFLAVSERDRQQMIELEHIAPDRVEVVPGGIPDLPPSERDIRADLGIAPDAAVLVSVAYLRPQKSLEVLIHAAAELRERHRSLRVLIVGRGEERLRLDSLIASLRLSETVTMLGARRDVMDVVRAADIAVCCSDFEGTPLAVLEYMAAAKPVVATNVGGLPELVRDGVTGLLVPPRRPSDLAERIHELLCDPEQARLMGLRGRELQRARFSITAMVSHIDRIYSELLAAAPARQHAQ